MVNAFMFGTHNAHTTQHFIRWMEGKVDTYSICIMFCLRHCQTHWPELVQKNVALMCIALIFKCTRSACMRYEWKLLQFGVNPMTPMWNYQMNQWLLCYTQQITRSRRLYYILINFHKIFNRFSLHLFVLWWRRWRWRWYWQLFNPF